MDAAARRLRASIAAHAMHAKHDPRKTTAKARDVYRESFTERARTEAAQRGEQISDEEARRRGYQLYCAEMKRRAYNSKKNRQKKAG